MAISRPSVDDTAAAQHPQHTSSADASPYFRVFNPILQGEKLDPDGVYVRRWVPELAALPAGLIHQP